MNEDVNIVLSTSVLLLDRGCIFVMRDRFTFNINHFALIIETSLPYCIDFYAKTLQNYISYDVYSMNLILITYHG